MVERVLGKDEVVGSIPTNGSIPPVPRNINFQNAGKKYFRTESNRMSRVGPRFDLEAPLQTTWLEHLVQFKDLLPTDLFPLLTSAFDPLSRQSNLLASVVSFQPVGSFVKSRRQHTSRRLPSQGHPKCWHGFKLHCDGGATAIRSVAFSPAPLCMIRKWPFR